MNQVLLPSKSIIAVDKTADIIHSAFGIDKSKAIDSYALAKKMGLLSRNTKNGSRWFSSAELQNYRTKNSTKANANRQQLAERIAFYVVSSATSESDANGKNVQAIVDSLALSLLLPKDEAIFLYQTLKEKGKTDEDSYAFIAKKYGVSTDAVSARLAQILK